jgi:hypothetical protein
MNVNQKSKQAEVRPLDQEDYHYNVIDAVMIVPKKKKSRKRLMYRTATRMFELPNTSVAGRAISCNSSTRITGDEVDTNSSRQAQPQTVCVQNKIGGTVTVAGARKVCQVSNHLSAIREALQYLSWP